MTDIAAISIQKLHRGIALIITTKGGEIVTYKLSASDAKRLLESLFRVISPNWGGERDRAGKRKD